MAAPDLYLGLSDTGSLIDEVKSKSTPAVVYYDALDKNAQFPHLYLNYTDSSPHESQPTAVGQGQHVRAYKQIQLFEPHGLKPKPAPCILFVAIEPGKGTEAELDTWYREEHLLLYAKMPGFRRTTRYELLRSSREGVPRYLAIHEFDSTDVPSEQVTAAAATDWAKTLLSKATARERGFYQLRG